MAYEVSGSAFQIRELPVVRRMLPITLAKIVLTTHIQLLQWPHGKQQQQLMAVYIDLGCARKQKYVIIYY